MSEKRTALKYHTAPKFGRPVICWEKGGSVNIQLRTKTWAESLKGEWKGGAIGVLGLVGAALGVVAPIGAGFYLYRRSGDLTAMLLCGSALAAVVLIFLGMTAAKAGLHVRISASAAGVEFWVSGPMDPRSYAWGPGEIRRVQAKWVEDGEVTRGGLEIESGGKTRVLLEDFDRRVCAGWQRRSRGRWG